MKKLKLGIKIKKVTENAESTRVFTEKSLEEINKATDLLDEVMVEINELSFMLAR